MSRYGEYDLRFGFIPDPDVQPTHTQTNADRIRAMTDEELAEFFVNRMSCTWCQAVDDDDDCEDRCALTWLDWLKQEVDE